MLVNPTLMRPIVVDLTPKQVSVHVQSFCKSVCANSEPVYLEITPAENAKQNECYENVSRYCERHGGAIQYGWAIWTWPKVWLKAQHHAIWRGDTGAMIDVTPNTPDCHSVLFLPDPAVSHDPSRKTHVPNILRPLKGDEDILAIGRIERAILDYEDAHRLPGMQEVRVNREEYGHLQLAKEAALFRVMLKYIRPSQPCPCMSGERFRDCHMGPGSDFLSQWDNDTQNEFE